MNGTPRHVKELFDPAAAVHRRRCGTLVFDATRAGQKNAPGIGIARHSVYGTHHE
jgi:hypothetical protein